MRHSHLIQFGIGVAIVFGAITVIGQDHRSVTPPGPAIPAPAVTRDATTPQATPAEEHDRAAAGGQYTSPGQINVGY